MVITEVPEQYYTYDGRLGSFQSAQPLSKRRASNAHSKAPKSMRWPHSSLPAEEMAKAGFFHYPTQDSPDNTVCFLCLKAIDGWEADDDPQKEHLKHSPHCGWAIVASVNAGDAELVEEYPLSSRMIAARLATFGDRWPHESKKGWKCKVKQLVDAGWKYTPTLESDDMATCTYCELGLDGWEPSDKPLDEHHKRSPDCHFFSLINEYKQKSPPKKATRGRKPRASKASRLSTQSTFTTTSEAPSFADTAAEEGDSVLTTATNSTVTSKAGKGKKTVTKGRKAKAKKEEPVQDIPAPEPEDDDFSVKVEQPKTTRGKKRASEAMDESTLIATQAPPPKRRATRTRGSMAPEDPSLAPSVVPEDDTTMTSPEDLVVTKKKGRKGRESTAKSMRNVSSASTASKASLRMAVLDDEEIDKMLEADLERPLTDEEDNTAAPGPSGAGQVGKEASTAPVKKATRGSRINNEDHVMFGTEQVEIDESAIDAELKAMEVEESKPLPKAKGAKGRQTRKPSAKQQAVAQKAAEAEAKREAELKEQILEQEPQKAPARSIRASGLSANESILSTMDNDDSGNESDQSMASQSTVVRGGNSRRGSTLKKGKKGGKVASRKIEEIIKTSVEVTTEDAPRKQAGRPKKAAHVDETKTADEVQYPDMAMSKQQPISEPASKAKQVAKAKGKGRALLEPTIESQPEPAPALTPKRSTKELTPTPSPQSSDAENHPPSSKPSTIKPPTHQTSRVPLAVSTPTQAMSPSKRNILAGLQSSNPWTPVNLDEIFTSTPGVEQENYDVLKEGSEKVKGGNLTSPEKRMSVEEWILFNANLAEEKLRRECEGMVSVFEREGGRAMRVLEGIECEE